MTGMLASFVSDAPHSTLLLFVCCYIFYYLFITPVLLHFFANDFSQNYTQQMRKHLRKNHTFVAKYSVVRKASGAARVGTNETLQGNFNTLKLCTYDFTHVVWVFVVFSVNAYNIFVLINFVFFVLLQVCSQSRMEVGIRCQKG